MRAIVQFADQTLEDRRRSYDGVPLSWVASIPVSGKEIQLRPAFRAFLLYPFTEFASFSEHSNVAYKRIDDGDAS